MFAKLADSLGDRSCKHNLHSVAQSQKTTLNHGQGSDTPQGCRLQNSTYQKQACSTHSFCIHNHSLVRVLSFAHTSVCCTQLMLWEAVIVCWLGIRGGRGGHRLLTAETISNKSHINPGSVEEVNQLGKQFEGHRVEARRGFAAKHNRSDVGVCNCMHTDIGRGL